MSAEQIQMISNIALISLFALICVGLAIAMIRGWKKGVWRMSYRMLFMLTLVILAFCLLKPVTEALSMFPLNIFGYNSIILSNKAGETYYVAITNLKDTLTAFFEGYYKINHIAYSSEKITQIALALTDSTIKLVFVLISLLCILIFGNLLSWLFWKLIFHRLVPLACQKLHRVRWLAMLQNGITFLLLFTLFIAPLSTLLNLANSSYQKSKDSVNRDNEIVDSVAAFLDTYNQSIFCNLFSWSADENGMTFDSKLMGYLTQSDMGGSTLNLSNELNNVLDVAFCLTDGIGEDFSQGIAYGNLLTEETINAVFDGLANSELFTTILPVAITAACNLEQVEEYADLSYVDMSDVDFAGEFENIEKFFMSVIDSGVLDEFFTPEGYLIESLNTKALITNIVTDDETFGNIIDSLSFIDDSEFLSRLMPSVILMVEQMAPEAAKYLPTTYDELVSIKWGQELGILLDTVQKIATIGDDNEILNTILDATLPTTASKKRMAEDPTSESGNLVSDLVPVLLKHIDEIRTILIGDSTDSHDTNGKTIVDGSNPNSRYNLLDGELIKWIFSPICDLLSTALASSMSDTTQLTNKIEKAKDILCEVTNWRNNFRTDFGNTFDVLKELAQYDGITTLFTNAGEMFNDLGNIDTAYPGLRLALVDAMIELDDCVFLSAVIGPLFENILTTQVGALDSIGLDKDLLIQGFRYCSGDIAGHEDVKILGHELAYILYNIGSLGELTNLTNSSDIMASFDKKAATNVASLLDLLYNSILINGVDGACNLIKDNYFNALDYVFGSLNQPDLDIDISVYENRNDIQWSNAQTTTGKYAGFSMMSDALDQDYDAISSGTTKYRGENGNLALAIYTLASQDLLGVFSDTTKTLKDFTDAPTRLKIKNTLLACGESIILNDNVGALLDSKIGDKGITDNEAKFANVKDWRQEALVIDNLLYRVNAFEGDLGNLNLSSCSDIVALNDMLHALASSTIFFNENNEYIFSHWIYSKVAGSSGLGGSLDLFKDPDNWDTSLWGTKPAAIGGDDTHVIAKNDFYSLDDISDWVNPNYSYDFDYSSYGDKSTSNYYSKNNAFYNNYFARGSVVGEGYRSDELGRICEVIYFVSCTGLEMDNIQNADTNTFNGVLTAVNGTDTLRMAVYNAFEKVCDVVSGSELINLGEARNEYLIDCNVSTGAVGLPHASRDLRQDEIDIVTNLFDIYKELGNEGIGNIAAISDAKIDVISKAICSMAGSYVYHKLGPITPNTMTAFQSLVSKVYDNDCFKDGLLYRSSSSKDAANELAGLYSSFDSKVEYIVKTVYPYGSGSNTTAQQDEINLIFSTLKEVKPLINGSGELSIADIDFSDSSIISVIETVLTNFDDSASLYDVVPNLFYNMFNNGNFDSLGSDNFFKNANVEFMYDKANGIYINKVGHTEIGHIVNILSSYASLPSDANFSNLSDPTALDAILTPMKQILEDSYASEMFHQSNEFLGEDKDKLTVFESLVNKLLTESQLDNYSFKGNNEFNGIAVSDKGTKTFKRIKAMSKVDLDNSSTNATLQSYSSRWFTSTSHGTGEIDHLFNLIETVSNSGMTNMSDSSSAFTSMSPTTIVNLTTAMNKVYLTHDALAGFLSDGFDSMGLSAKTTYNSVQFANYKLNQYDFDNPTDVSADDELSKLNDILNSMYDSTNSQFIDISNMQTATNNSDFSLESIMKYVSDSMIFNSKSIEVSSKPIEARGVFMYNIFCGSDVGMSSYISGADNDQKLELLNSIFKITSNESTKGYDAAKEGRVLQKIISQASALTNIMAGSGDAIDKVYNNIDLITSLIEITYQENDGGNIIPGRAYFASEIISGIINDAMKDEYINIHAGTNGAILDPTFEVVAFKNYDVNNLASTLNDSSYDLLQEVEKVGIKAGIELFQTLKGITGTIDAETIAKLPVLFKQMGEAGKDQSQIAIVYYASRSSTKISSLASVKAASLTFAGSTDPIWHEYVINARTPDTAIWDASNPFSFEAYGNSLATYLSRSI